MHIFRPHNARREDGNSRRAAVALFPGVVTRRDGARDLVPNSRGDLGYQSLQALAVVRKRSPVGIAEPVNDRSRRAESPTDSNWFNQSLDANSNRRTF